MSTLDADILLCYSRATMSQSQLQLKREGVDQKDLTVSTPEEFVRQFGGNRVINRVQLYRLSPVTIRKSMR